MDRTSKHNYYLDIAQTVSERSTCIRRRFGAIIVKNDVIIATGYNGAPRGRLNCSDIESCVREEMNVPRGERYELCRAVHAEANAIIAASREQMQGATMYMCCTDPWTKDVVGSICSCAMCKRLIINAGIKEVVAREDKENYTIYQVSDWVRNDDSRNVTFGY